MVQYHLGAMSQGQLTPLLLLNGVDVFQRSNDDGTVPPGCNAQGQLIPLLLLNGVDVFQRSNGDGTVPPGCNESGTTHSSLAPKWC